MNEHLEEPIVIDVSMEEPEIAGANDSPSPEYEDQEEADVLMEEAEEAEAATRDRSPEYIAPGSRSRSREPRERSPVHK